jgi:hypothetical protein
MRHRRKRSLLGMPDESIGTGEVGGGYVRGGETFQGCGDSLQWIARFGIFRLLAAGSGTGV